MPSSHQLTAIMFADIAGYTATMQEDEALALQLKNKLLRKLETETATHNGRILSFRGDGALCSFSSTIEAVRAAMGVQLEMRKPPVVQLRIGMHTGDVIMDDNDVFGDGVNIASRLESFAVPGSILVSGKVYDDIKNQKDIQTVSLGMFRFKNVKDDTEIFAVSNAGLVTPDKNSLEGKGERITIEKEWRRCILVLPFVNMSNEPGQEYFSDGLTEELISKLAALSDIRVISRTTSMQYKNQEKDAKTIARENEVHYIVEGSVRRYGNNLRITAQLIDADNDAHLWAESYNGTIDDIFDIQEKVSEKIVRELKIQLTKEEQDFLQKHYTENSEAYQYYLKGRSLWKNRNEEDLKSALAWFEKALEKDAGYALAWTGLADTYSLMGEYSNVSRRILFPKQMAAINKALEIDNRISEAHISLATSLMLNEWDWKNSEKEFKIGLELNPKYATGHHWYGEWLLFTGKTEEAFDEINLAMTLDPVSPGILKDKGIFYYYNRQYTQAINMGLMTLELRENFTPAHRLLSLAYAASGMFDEAIEANRHWGENTGNAIKTEIALAEIYALAGRRDEAKSILQKTQELVTPNDNRGIALVYAALKEADMVFTWLEKSYASHEESLCNLMVDSKWDAFRTDARFTALLKKIGLLQYQVGKANQ